MGLKIGVSDAGTFVGGNLYRMGGHSYLGVTDVSIKNLMGKNTAINGSNEVQGFIRESSVPEVDVTVNGPSDEMMSSVLGESTTTDKGGFNIPGDISPVNFLYVTSPVFNTNKEELLIFPSTRATMTTLDLKTNTETKKNQEPVKITFDAAYSDAIGAAWAHKTIEKGTAIQVLTSAFPGLSTTEIKGDYDTLASDDPTIKHDSGSGH